MPFCAFLNGMPPSRKEIPKLTNRCAGVWISQLDDVIVDFDFAQLAGSNEIAGNFNVRFGRGPVRRSDDCARSLLRTRSP